MIMKTIGLIGGMTWLSSLEYYKLINKLVQERLGDQHSAKIILISHDFAEIATLQRNGRWDILTDMMIDSAVTLEKAGAGLVVMCVNTMHRVADDIIDKIGIPLLHIVDSTAQQIKQLNLKKIGLLGTKFTMEQDFFSGKLEREHSITAIIPNEAERNAIQEIIYQELALGEFRAESKEYIEKVIQCLTRRGAQGVILGCTELPLLIKPENDIIPPFDTTIHVKAAVNLALSCDRPPRR
jgi:aspartate racemase